MPACDTCGAPARVVVRDTPTGRLRELCTLHNRGPLELLWVIR